MLVGWVWEFVSEGTNLVSFDNVTMNGWLSVSIDRFEWSSGFDLLKARLNAF